MNGLSQNWQTEDRLRRNNLKISGIPELVQQSYRSLYAAALFKFLIPSLSDLDVTVDRINCLPKPSHLSDQWLLHLHFFRIKKTLMSIM